ncbi:hypothetical protein SEA_KABOCHA_41 [Gordonia phage Kabocha]|uniref:Uncharacterized protein n=1 Tax=Gordonia phage Chidiebere TaxID=2656530 RepID=A0A649VKZ4_9CAUD|nr:hypothetical protein PQD14_gp040 [Gordonia phage Chidiebere]AZS07894.1 hypothetical protein PBI_GRAY_40 [Gordonia phage Gray]WAA19828.1 hypothetical protein SEA_KABOCHA_41 [Gordonia phage Kabocha]WAA20018.1 hypothetical protein SEA_HANEM_40 [Gordonia phage Hanem]WNM67060.1 hypothetical protein SEA_SCHOMBER_39 [Gordonia Phage Schomber]QGJ92931.1 hypothetical protein PBI_CHIDIEBERE_40 [Gordonia phage Chidiebere]
MATRSNRRPRKAATTATETTQNPDPAVDPAQGDSQAATGASGADTPAPPLSDAPPAPADNTGTAPDPVAQAAAEQDAETKPAEVPGADVAPDENPNVDESTLEENEFRQFWVDYCKRRGYVMPKGHVLFPGEPLTFRGNILRGTTVELTEDVFRMVIPFRSRRPIFTQVAKRGQVVPKVGFITKDAYQDATRDLYDALSTEA